MRQVLGEVVYLAIEHIKPGINRLKLVVNSIKPGINRLKFVVNRVKPGVNRLKLVVNRLKPGVNNVKTGVNNVKTATQFAQIVLSGQVFVQCLRDRAHHGLGLLHFKAGILQGFGRLERVEITHVHIPIPSARSKAL